MYLGASPLVSSQVRQGGRTATTPHPFFFLSPRPSVRVHITSPRSLSLSLTIRCLSLSLSLSRLYRYTDASRFIPGNCLLNFRGDEATTPERLVSPLPPPPPPPPNTQRHFSCKGGRRGQKGNDRQNCFPVTVKICRREPDLTA